MTIEELGIEKMTTHKKLSINPIDLLIDDFIHLLNHSFQAKVVDTIIKLQSLQTSSEVKRQLIQFMYVDYDYHMQIQVANTKTEKRCNKCNSFLYSPVQDIIINNISHKSEKFNIFYCYPCKEFSHKLPKIAEILRERLQSQIES